MLTWPRPVEYTYGIWPPTRKLACTPGIVTKSGAERMRASPLWMMRFNVGARYVVRKNGPMFRALPAPEDELPSTTGNDALPSEYCVGFTTSFGVADCR